MNEDPSYIRAFSLHLSRTLDELGLNRKTVKRRRDTFLYEEQNGNISDRIFGAENTRYHFGSQTEGSTTPGLQSDLDTLFVYPNYNVIQDWADWERGKENLLMLQEDTAPGYCRLQLLRSDIPTAKQDVPNAHFTFDSSGRVVMKNTLAYNLINLQMQEMKTDRNGPAVSGCCGLGTMDFDYIFAFGCNSWPEQANSFTNRHRRYGWPSKRVIQQCVEQGVFLVSVGYKLSPTEHLEWRISASFAERCLMFSLNIVHIKCYVVLKMLMKSFVEPRVGKSISSYHCKTAVLYCTENTEPGFWQDDNLLQCVTQCLMKLLAWVMDGFCPQFIISEENLFVGKVTAQNRGALQAVLTELVKCSGRKLLDVKIDKLGVILQRRLNSIPSTIPVLDSLDTVMLHAYFNIDIHENIHYRVLGLLLHCKNSKPSTVVCFICETIGMLRGRIEQSNKHERRATQTFIVFLYRWLGSILASISLSRKMRVPRQAIQLLHIGGKSDVATMLKLASVFYCNGDARKAVLVFHRIKTYYERNEMVSICGCYDNHNLQMFLLKGRMERPTGFALCASFSPQEIYAAPPALRYEMFRSVGDDIQHRDRLHDKWMDLAVVDCLPYLYFLQFMVYRQVGQRDLQTRALHNLDWCIREDNDFRHIETAWNLLGQCMYLEHEPDAALACYKTSLQIRPRNNAANWHVPILCYDALKDGRLTT